MSLKRIVKPKVGPKVLTAKVDALFSSGGVNERFATNIAGILRALKERKKIERLNNSQLRGILKGGSLRFVNQRLVAIGQKPITIEEALAWINQKHL